MNVIAEGVKGLLRIRSDSFVVCALRICEASERRASGFGGSWMAVDGGVGDWRAVWKLCMRALVDDNVIRSVARLSVSLDGAILSKGYCTFRLAMLKFVGFDDILSVKASRWWPYQSWYQNTLAARAFWHDFRQTSTDIKSNGLLKSR